MIINFVRLRLAGRDDFDVIRSLLYDLDEIAYEAKKTRVKPPHESALTEARFGAWLENRQTRLVLALYKEDVVGFSRIELQERPETRTTSAELILRIHEVIVRAKLRRNGIGKLLVEDINTLAHYFDVDRLELTVPHFNEGAARFFEKQALKPFFRIMGRERAKR